MNNINCDDFMDYMWNTWYESNPYTTEGVENIAKHFNMTVDEVLTYVKDYDWDINKEIKYRTIEKWGSKIYVQRPEHENMVFIDGNDGDLQYYYYCRKCGTIVHSDHSDESCMTRILCPHCSHLDKYPLESFTPKDKKYTAHAGYYACTKTYNLWLVTPLAVVISNIKYWFTAKKEDKVFYSSKKGKWISSNYDFITQQIGWYMENRKVKPNYHTWSVSDMDAEFRKYYE